MHCNGQLPSNLINAGINNLTYHIINSKNNIYNIPTAVRPCPITIFFDLLNELLLFNANLIHPLQWPT